MRLLLSGEETFEEAQEMVADRTDIFKTINRFRQKIAENDFQSTLISMTKEQRDKCLYELRRIQKRTEQLLKRVS